MKEVQYGAEVRVLSVEKKFHRNGNYFEYVFNYTAFYFSSHSYEITKRDVPRLLHVPEKCGPPLEKLKLYVIGCIWGERCVFMREFDKLTEKEKELIKSTRTYANYYFLDWYSY
ncbi:hypothetical protein ANCCAN_00931 [Ancylostoma caninum]|uniref:Uncharacterized protein n=1 Tax=Ancylostoma caninum TaxID=29170 RepID=A0A368H8P6_ANCCA|nr:hypothetical protein ANCCAN_00931 [Ancylostoma caninum]